MFRSIHLTFKTRWNPNNTKLTKYCVPKFTYRCLSSENSNESSRISSGLPDILFQKAGPEHLQTVHELLRDSFFKDEPIVKALGLVDKLDPNFIQAEAKFILKGYSILAIDKNSKQVIAAAINKPITLEEVKAAPGIIEEIKCPNTQKLARFWYNLTIKPNIFELFNLVEYLEVCLLVTTEAARGKHLAEKLTRASIQFASDMGQPLAAICCTNIASARIAQKLDMVQIGRSCISNYFSGSDLLAISSLPHPNDKIYIFAKVLR